MKERDPRNGCELCLMNYGMESVTHDSICASKHSLAVIAAGHRKPTFILIFPKAHKKKMKDVKKNADLHQDLKDLIRRTERKLREKYKAKSFEVKWCDSGMLLHFSAGGGLPLRGVNAHAHCKMDVWYR